MPKVDINLLVYKRTTWHETSKNRFVQNRSSFSDTVPGQGLQRPRARGRFPVLSISSFTINWQLNILNLLKRKNGRDQLFKLIVYDWKNHMARLRSRQTGLPPPSIHTHLVFFINWTFSGSTFDLVRCVCLFGCQFLYVFHLPCVYMILVRFMWLRWHTFWERAAHCVSICFLCKLTFVI